MGRSKYTVNVEWTEDNQESVSTFKDEFECDANHRNQAMQKISNRIKSGSIISRYNQNRIYEGYEIESEIQNIEVVDKQVRKKTCGFTGG